MSSPRKRAKASFEERPSGDPVTLTPLDSRPRSESRAGLRGNDDIYARSFCNRFLAPPLLLLRALADGDLDLQVLVVALEPYRGGLPVDEGRQQFQLRLRILNTS